MFAGENTYISSPLQKRRGTACGGGDGINTASVLLPKTPLCRACPPSVYYILIRYKSHGKTMKTGRKIVNLKKVSVKKFQKIIIC